MMPSEQGKSILEQPDSGSDSQHNTTVGEPAQTKAPDTQPRMGSTPPASEEVIWTGTWDSEQWGKMELIQDGDKVTGNYSWDDGKIEGTVSGNTLHGTWSESPSYAHPDDAGDFEFTLSEDGNTFTGKWCYGSDGEWDGDWSGEKLTEKITLING